MEGKPGDSLPNVNLYGIPINLVILIDGLTNERMKSGHELFTEHLKSIVPEFSCTWKWYLPVEHRGEVETIEVFPFFFGLKPDLNPGRAGFEMYDDGDLPSTSKSFLKIRSQEPKKIVSLAASLGIYARCSRYSKDGKSVLLAAKSDSQILQIKDIVKNYCRLSHHYYPGPNWKKRILCNSNHFSLVGWCHGALRIALEMVGISYIFTDKTIQISGAEYQSKLISIATMQSRIKKILMMKKIPLIYYKHHAYEARHGLDKAHAAKETATLTSCALHEMTKLDPQINCLIISDHNSEIGEDKTLAGATVYGLISNKDWVIENFNVITPHVCISQDKLVQFLNISNINL